MARANHVAGLGGREKKYQEMHSQRTGMLEGRAGNTAHAAYSVNQIED
jgi:hypothetical protein